MRWTIGVGMVVLAMGNGASVSTVVADERAATKPIRALLISGGCCHDYTAQKVILSEGVSARANVEWTLVQQGGSSRDTKIDVYKKDDWAKGFDVVVHNECFGSVEDVAWVERIARAHKEGVGAVVIHCSMHSYRAAKTDEWRKLLGVTSRRHERGRAVAVENLKADHPIMKEFPPTWQTPQGELYVIEKTWPNCTPLAQAYGRDTKKNQVCVWTNTYGKARVFGTTLGHHNVTMSHEVYLDMMARGVLWVADKLDQDGLPKPGYGPKPAK